MRGVCFWKSKINKGSSLNTILVSSDFIAYAHWPLNMSNSTWAVSCRCFICSQDLMKDLKSELSKNLERLIIGLMLTPAEFDAKMMRKAMEVKFIQIAIFLNTRQAFYMSIVDLVDSVYMCIKERSSWVEYAVNHFLCLWWLRDDWIIFYTNQGYKNVYEAQRLHLKLSPSSGCWHRWTCSDRNSCNQEQWGNTCHECCLSTRWVWYQKGN